MRVRKDEQGQITDCGIRTNARPPCRRGINYPEVVLHAIWTCGGFGDQMCSRGLDTLDLHKALCTYCLVTASRVINIHRIILGI